ncbi:MAG: Blue-light-activated protein [Planctomycetaceae bacterium]|nr:Blue-light-activated protein [Planctomycetaceae bacterium]
MQERQESNTVTSGCDSDKRRNTALRISMAYFGFSLLWILLIDRALIWLGVPGELSFWVAAVKGMLFILVSAVFVYWLVCGAVVSHKEFTARKIGEESLQESTRRFRALADAIPQIVWTAAPDGGLTSLNAKAEEYTGLGIENLTGWSWEQVIHPDDLPQTLQHWGETLRLGIPRDIEFRIRRHDGQYRWHITRQVPIRGPEEAIVAWYGTCTDIEDLKRTQETLLNQRTLLRTLIDSIPEVIFSKDAAGRYSLCNRELLAFTGHSTENELVGKTVFEVFAGNHAQSAHADDMRVILHGETILNREELARDASGRETWRLVNKAPLRDHTGAIVGLVGISRDIQKRKENDQLLMESRERLNLALAAAQMGTWDWDLRTNQVVRSPESLMILGGESFQWDYDEFLRLIHPDDVESVQAALHRTIKEQVGFTMEFRIVRMDGAIRWVQDIGRTHCDETGRPVRMTGVIQDITQRKLAEDTVRQSKEMLRLVLDNIPQGVFWKDRESRYLGCNQVVARAMGLASPDAINGLSNEDMPSITREQDEYFKRKDREVMESDSALHHILETITLENGKTIWLDTNKVPMHDPQGRVIGILGTWEDITERKRLEAQFQQAQKMEAVGRLAGGIAHDFNNLLTIIMGYSELVLEGLASGDPQRDWVLSIRDAGERAARLTQQLLAFSRKTIIEPKLVDLNELVAKSVKLFRRVIGEDIFLTVVPAPQLPLIRADLGQLEQVIMNLVVNARDAMPTGGRITIETRSVELEMNDISLYPDSKPGRYVRLTITDTGSGMSEELKSKIFEPFFTTKGVGKGTGLGLAVVDGVIKQCDGFVGVESIVGHGTSFHVLFPISEEAKAEPESEHAKFFGRGTETILLVEDEAEVRALAKITLEAQGFKVLVAGNGVAALQLLKDQPEQIHLLLTDVVMPEMAGRQLAESMRILQPGIRILYMSGYTDDAIVHHGIVQATDAFIQKPFTPLGLARKARSVLDGTPTENSK